jgi:hypothetical protein
MRLAAPITAVALAGLVLPAGAAARRPDLLRGATLHAAAGSLTISESRCPAGSSDCGHVTLRESVSTRPQPRTRLVGGRVGFPVGVRVAAAGGGRCEAESPTTIITASDGSAQILTGASRVVPGKFNATRIVVAGGKRSVRIGWLEPLSPGIACNYFDERGTELAVPAGPPLQSVRLPARTLARSRFSATIAGTQQWTEQAADGTQIRGTATWRLRLDYRRAKS